MMIASRSGRASLCWLTFLLALASPTGLTSSQAADRHCLWKVEGPKTTVHLLGSIHFLKKDRFPLAAPLEQAFERAQVVAFETDLEAMDTPQAQLDIVGKAKLPDGQTLADRVSKETYEKLGHHLKASNAPVGAFDPYRPWFVAVALLAIELPKLGVDPTYGVDNHYHKRAREGGKTILPLATVEEHLGVFTSMTKDEEQVLLESTLKDLKNLREQYNELVTAWLKGDALTLDRYLNQMSVEQPRLYQRLVSDRNKQWIPPIEKLVRGDKPAVVIVGAAHLVGKDSVVELLQKKGFKMIQE
jgi:uncharacterized protein YbaP (TraB family)